MLFLNTKEYEKARPLLELALKVRRICIGEDSLDTAVSMHNLGFLYVEKAEWESACPVLERAVEIRTHLCEGGADDPLTMSSVCLLSAVIVEVGRGDEARPILHRTLDYQLETLGPNNLETAMTRHYLGVLLLESGEREVEAEAEQQLMAVRAVRSAAGAPKTPGSTSPHTR